MDAVFIISISGDEILPDRLVEGILTVLVNLKRFIVGAVN
jgi:hypothetical protein